MPDWIVTVLERYGYVGVFFVIALENVFPPIPSEVILPLSGFMTTTTRLTIPGVVAAATAGSLGGALALYGVGLIFDIKRLDRIIERWGHLLRIKSEDIYKADAWFDRYGYWTVLFCRMVPLIRSLISVPAGMARMKLPLFILFTGLGTFVWNVLLVSLGAALGESWTEITHFMEVYKTIAYAALGVLGALLILLFLRSRRQGAR